MNWLPTTLSNFLTERTGRIKHEEANGLGLQRIKKIDFSGAIHLEEQTATRTNMIRVKAGDLVISGINAAKGAIAVYEGAEDVLATIHYSSYEFDPDKISVEFLKWFFSSSEFSELLKEQIPGGIKTELKPKHILPLQVSLPKPAEQLTISKRLNSIRTEQLRIENEITHQQTLLGKLKQAILQEAIQGKLTADWRAANPDVEPASELLQRIQAEKARLIAEKKIRKEKPLPEITPEEIPFEIPDGWEWCRFDHLLQVRSGVTKGKKYDEKLVETPYLRVANVQRGHLDLSTVTTIAVPVSEQEKYALEKNDLLITEGGDPDKVGRCVIWKSEIPNCIHQNHVFSTRAWSKADISIPLMSLFVNAPSTREHFLGNYKQTTNLASINKTVLRTTLIPLPPLAEQAAIVERVEALMATCRELEAEIERSRTHAADLLQAVLNEAFAPAS